MDYILFQILTTVENTFEQALHMGNFWETHENRVEYTRKCISVTPNRLSVQQQ